MKKIVELLIKDPNFESDELGVDVVSLVETPAIGYTWQMFSDDDCTDCFDLEDACLPGYEAIGLKRKNGRLVPNCVPVEMQKFESYTDYPEAAKANAQRAIDWAEEHGWGDCGTDVGKQRAHQLAKGEAISEDTIARMASFRRHQQNSDTPYSEGCGKLMWDAWGGEAGIAWAERKLESIREAMDVDTGNLSPYVDQDDEKLLVKVQNAIYTAAETLGEEHDPESTTYLSIHNFAEGASVAGIADAVKALDILKGRADSTEEFQTVYKYEGPISGNSRKFCRAMVRLSRTKFWTRDDINRMTSAGVNSDFNSPIRGGNYDIFRYAGGSRCRHRWVEYKMFRNEQGRTLLINVGDASTPPANTPNQGFVNNEQRKKADQWYAINKNRFAKQHEFAIDSEDERIVVAPAMVPNNLIRRIDEKGMEYYVYFSKETVKDISEKYFAKNHTNNTDINHDGAVTKSNTVLESWIVDDPNVDKSKLYGFDVPAGTWMMSMRINDENTWSKIKNGELKGYSVAGNFLELAK